ncbi:MAG: NUDIX domain-containing protein [Candidatus Aenigmatarchaeota archaeon]|jgi:8-oxo-dGTP diphosphatase
MIFTRVATDCIAEKNGKILMVRRMLPPFIGAYAFPGGHLKYNEAVEKCVVRETYEETGIIVKPIEILGVYSKKDRDPRGHVVSIVFVCKPLSSKLKSSFEGKAEWIPLKLLKKMKLAFDHNKILNDYLKWKKNKKTFWSDKNG